MASPPFTIDETIPADSDIVSQHPSGARTFRDVVESWHDFEHGAASGRHKIPKGTVAARDAITDWEAGSLWINTDTTPDTLQMNTGTKATPVWITLGSVVITTRGDVIIGDASGNASRLAVGASNQVLRSDGTDIIWGTIQTTNIANNAVTGPKIAMGSDAQGDTLYYNGTDYVRLAKGTNGQFLKIGATIPAWDTIVPGSRVWLHTETVGGSVATVDIEEGDFDWTAYDIYEFEFINIAVVTDDVDMYVRLYDTVLAAWQAGASDYKWANIGKEPGGTGGSANASDTKIQLDHNSSSGDGVGNAAGETFECSMKIYAPADGDVAIQWTCGHDDATATPNTNSSSGRGKYIGASNAVSGLRLLTQSGNIDGGKIVVWGIKTS